MLDQNAALTWMQGRLCLSGSIHANNVMALYTQGVEMMRAASTIECDCSKLYSSDSSMLALMVEWIKYAQATHKHLYFTHLSTEIITIIRAAGLQSIIPMAGEAHCEV